MSRRTTLHLAHLAGACALLLVVVACAGPKTATTAPPVAKGKKNSQITIGYVTKSASNQGWTIINQGAADAARQAGVKLVTVGPDQAESLSGQQDAIENMISRRVGAIALAPVDSAAVAPSVKAAETAGIPVVAVDTAVTGAKVASFVATDSLRAGELQGEWVAQQIPDNAQVLVVNGQLSQSTGRERFDGFRTALLKAKPGVKIYQVQTDWDQTQAQNGVESLLNAHPGISVIANAWDGGTMGAVAAVQGMRKKPGQIKIVGIDGAPDALAEMKQGWVQADVAQRLYQEGFQGVMTALEAAKGERVAPRIDTGETVVLPANVDTFAQANHLAKYMGGS